MNSLCLQCGWSEAEDDRLLCTTCRSGVEPPGVVAWTIEPDGEWEEAWIVTAWGDTGDRYHEGGPVIYNQRRYDTLAAAKDVIPDGAVEDHAMPTPYLAYAMPDPPIPVT